MAALREPPVRNQIDWPESTTKPNKKGKAGGKGKQGTGKARVPPPMAKDLNLQEGALRNENGTHARPLRNFGPGVCGYKLVDPEEAKPWVENQKSLSADELALAILTPKCPFQAHKKCQSIQAPAITETGRPVLVQVCLHQFGRQKAAPAKTVNEVQVQHSHVIALATFRDEMGHEQRQCLTTNPLKTIFQVLDIGDQQKQILGPPWGRSWQQARRQATPEQADTFGTSGIYVRPKTEGPKPNNQYSVI